MVRMKAASQESAPVRSRQPRIKFMFGKLHMNDSSAGSTWESTMASSDRVLKIGWYVPYRR